MSVHRFGVELSPIALTLWFQSAEVAALMVRVRRALADRTAVEGGTILGICITLLTMLPGAMSYICPYDAGPHPAPLVDRLKNISYCVAVHSRILKARSTPAEITLGTQPGKHSIVTGEQR
jgi:hypothetical protein